MSAIATPVSENLFCHRIFKIVKPIRLLDDRELRELVSEQDVAEPEPVEFPHDDADRLDVQFLIERVAA